MLFPSPYLSYPNLFLEGITQFKEFLPIIREAKVVASWFGTVFVTSPQLKQPTSADSLRWEMRSLLNNHPHFSESERSIIREITQKIAELEGSEQQTYEDLPIWLKIARTAYIILTLQWSYQKRIPPLDENDTDCFDQNFDIEISEYWNHYTPIQVCSYACLPGHCVLNNLKGKFKENNNVTTRIPAQLVAKAIRLENEKIARQNANNGIFHRWWPLGQKPITFVPMGV